MTATLLVILWCLAIPFGQDAPGPSGKAPKDFCKGAQSQVELNECSAAAYRDADQELNAFYSSVRKKLDQPDVLRLQDAQRAWITYRDKNCEAGAGLYDGGSIRPLIYFNCMERATRSRIAELHAIYDTGNR